MIGSIFLHRVNSIQIVAAEWGASQKVSLEHELAGMRKTLGHLWEMSTGEIPANIQRVPLSHLAHQ